MAIEYIESDLFKKDFKKLSKRFSTLEEDFNTAKKSAIELLHIVGIDNYSIIRLTEYYNGSLCIYKLRKFACKSLKGRGVQSGVRIIYAFYEEKKSIEFIEIYFKADQENENRERIIAWVKKNGFI